MTDKETDEIPEPVPMRKPQQPRRQPRGRIISISRMQDGRPIQFGTFPEAVIGEPLEQRILPFIEERNFGFGEWKVDIRTAKGHFERSFDFSIEEPHGNGGRVIDIEDGFLDADADDLDSDYSEPADTGNMTATEVENLLLKERLRRLEEDTQRQRSAGAAETNSMLGMLQQSWAQQRDFMMMMFQQAQSQSQQPQTDATSQALKLMEQSLGMVKSARAFADEIAPDGGGGEGGGSFLADGAKLLDSIGRNAGPFIPAIASMLTRPATGQPTPDISTPGGFQNAGTGEFADLAARARNTAKAPSEPPQGKAEGASA